MSTKAVCLLHYLIVTWLVPGKTPAVWAQVLCTPYNHAPVYSVIWNHMFIWSFSACWDILAFPQSTEFQHGLHAGLLMCICMWSVCMHRHMGWPHFIVFSEGLECMPSSARLSLLMQHAEKTQDIWWLFVDCKLVKIYCVQLCLDAIFVWSLTVTTLLLIELCQFISDLALILKPLQC